MSPLSDHDSGRLGPRTGLLAFSATGCDAGNFAESLPGGGSDSESAPSSSRPGGSPASCLVKAGQGPASLTVADPDSVVDEPEPDVLALELTGRWVRDDRFFRAAHRARFIGACRTPELAELVVQEHNAALAAQGLHAPAPVTRR